MGKYTVDQIARVCWEMNRALQTADREALPDDPWDAAPAYRQVILRQLVGKVANGDLGNPQEAHEFWRSSMQKAGWTEGQEKDPVRGIHPFLRPWSRLQDWERLAQVIGFSIITRMGAVR